MELYCLEIMPNFPVEKAWEEFESKGYSVIFSEENDDHLAKLFVYFSSPEELKNFSFIESFAPYQLPEINWEDQWQIHGMDYENGMIHVDLKQFGGPDTIIHLEPGPGFGDLSHPTTRLVLKLMAQSLREPQPVLDIGCGSGILSLAAAAMGSPCIVGIDIELQAVLHSQKNAEINCLKNCHFYLPGEVNLPENQNWLIVMNMIQMEQKQAWEALTNSGCLQGQILTSGILIRDREIYLKQTHAWGWHLEKEAEEDGWLAFRFLIDNYNKPK